MRRGIAVEAALVLVVLAANASAQGERTQLAGVVTARRGNEIEVETVDRKLVRIRLGPETRYEGSAGSLRDLRVGSRVVIDAERTAAGWQGRLVRAGVVKPLPERPAQGSAPSGHAHGGGAPSPTPKQKEEPHAGHAHAHDAAPSSAAGQQSEALAGDDERSAPAPAASGHPGHAGGQAAERRTGTDAPSHDPAHAGAGTMTSSPTLYQSDMWLMAGMTPRDPLAGVAMPGWHWMTTGIARLAYNRQGGPSGDEAVESTNWTMLMGQRDLGRGRLTLMMMNSLEAATLEKGGTPQLFQTGETFDGRPLVDRQHPHDFFMNLSATYRRSLGPRGAWWVQAAVRGEPALGPTTFMHRASAGENGAAILSHHWQDATHITDDVITVGAGWRWLWADASVFHGQEPDEGRWDLDPGGLDSVAGRLKASFESGWSAQVSHGFLREPEAPLEPGDARRTTASVHYGEEGDRPLALSLVWGRNREEHGTFDGWVLEGAYQLTANDHLYSRAERVDRDRHLLESKGLAPEEEEGDGDPVATVGALTLGYLRELRIFREVKWVDVVNLGLGGDVTVYDVPDGLENVYGDSPISARAFLRLRWGQPHGRGHAAGHGLAH